MDQAEEAELRAEGYSELYLATKKNDITKVNELLNAGADPNNGGTGSSPLHTAARQGFDKILERLLNVPETNLNVPDPNVLDDENKTPLHLAAEKGCAECVKLLLGKGADPNAVDGNKNISLNGGAYNGYRTPLHFAAAEGHTECVDLLLGKEADPNAVDGYKETPLHKAAKNGHAACIKLLLDAKADPNKKNWYGLTPLNVAKNNNKKECVEILKEVTSKWKIFNWTSPGGNKKRTAKQFKTIKSKKNARRKLKTIKSKKNRRR